MRAFYSDTFTLPLPADHRFPMGKYRRLRQAVVAAGLIEAADLRVPPPATDAELLRVHDAGYLERVKTGTLGEREVRRIGFPWSPALVERSRRSVGGTIAAARAALVDGVGLNLAGGTHHAFADRGEGFCVLNDVAVAARVLQDGGTMDGGTMDGGTVEGGPVEGGTVEGGPVERGPVERGPVEKVTVERVAVIDCDVHQGNGTAAIFAGDPTVFTLSIHGRGNYPFVKETSDLDIELPDGAGDDEYLEALGRGLKEALAGGVPLAFYIAGADPYRGDRYGRLALSREGLAERDRRVLGRCAALGVPVAVVMGGGYAAEDEVVSIHLETVRAAAASLGGRAPGGAVAQRIV